MDWTTITVILLSFVIWTVCVRAFPKVLATSVLKYVEHDYNKKLEELRGDIQASNSAIVSSVNYLTESQAELRSKVISAVEALWLATEKMHEAYSPILGLIVMLTPEELDACVSGRESAGLRSVLEEHGDGVQIFAETTKNIGSQLSGSEIIYVSSRLWLLYETILRVYGRIGYLVGRSLRDGKYHDWKRDKPMMSILRQTLTNDQINSAKESTIGGTHDILSWLKAEFVKEASELVRGSRELAHSVSEIHGILKDEVDNRYQRSS